MNHIKHYNCWGDLPHDGKKAARRRDVGNINLFLIPSLLRSGAGQDRRRGRRPM